MARTAGRATPFGLFSGVASGQLGNDTHIELDPREEYRRRTLRLATGDVAVPR